MFPPLQSPQDLSEEGATGLSPGLSYLEHVCQMLEEFADQQRHKQALQRGGDGLQEHQEVEVSQVGAALKASQQVGGADVALSPQVTTPVCLGSVSGLRLPPDRARSCRLYGSKVGRPRPREESG